MSVIVVVVVCFVVVCFVGRFILCFLVCVVELLLCLCVLLEGGVGFLLAD